MRGFNILSKNKKNKTIDNDTDIKNQVIATEMDFKLTDKTNYVKIFEDILEFHNKNNFKNRLNIKLKDGSPEEIDELIKNILIFCKEKNIPVSVKHIYNKWNGVRRTVDLILMKMNEYEDIIFNNFICKKDISNFFPLKQQCDIEKDFSYLKNMICVEENIFFNIEDEIVSFLATEEAETLFMEIEKRYKSSRFYKKIKQKIKIERNMRDIVSITKQNSFNTHTIYYSGEPKRIYTNLVLLYELDLALENFLVANRNPLSMDLIQKDDNIFNRCRFVLDDDVLIKAICFNTKLIEKAILILSKRNEEKELLLKLIEEEPEKVYFYLTKTKFATDKDICIKTIQKNPELLGMVVKYGIPEKKELNEIVIDYFKKKNMEG